MKPAVVVSGSLMGLGVIRALGRKQVPVVVVRYDKRDMGHASKWVREVVPSPHPEQQEQQFIGLLGDLAVRYPGALLVPASDVSLAVIPRHKGFLGSLGFTVASADDDVTKTFLDKTATAALAREAGVPAPVTIVPRVREDLEEYADRAKFPAILKPALSHRYNEVFGRKWARVEDLDHAVREYDRAVAAGFDVLLQEFIPGDELCGANYTPTSGTVVPVWSSPPGSCGTRRGSPAHRRLR